MRKLDPVLLLTASDIMANLSAGWFGAVFILPAFSSGVTELNLGLRIASWINDT